MLLELAPSAKKAKLRSCWCLRGNEPPKARKLLHSSAAQLLAPSTCPNYAPAGVCAAMSPQRECRCLRKLLHSSAAAGLFVFISISRQPNPAPAGVCAAMSPKCECFSCECRCIRVQMLVVKLTQTPLLLVSARPDTKCCWSSKIIITLRPK